MHDSRSAGNLESKKATNLSLPEAASVSKSLRLRAANVRKWFTNDKTL
jgi:hypothetical protein